MTCYEFHPEAQLDLDEIWEFIRAENQDAADRTVAEILSAVRALVSFPNRGHMRHDLTALPLRFIRVRRYLIAYAPEHRPLRVIAIIHGSRNPHLITNFLCDRNAQ